MSVSSFDDINIDQDEFMKGTPYSMSGICEYRFNAILLYYSIYDLNDAYKQPIATNLFGIVFLDGGNGSGQYTLSPVLKRKSFKGQSGRNAYFGNGYSFRVNIKTLSVYDNTDARIDDNTTTTSMYAEDFNDVIANFNKAIDVMNTNVRTTAAIQNQYMAMTRVLSDIRTSFDSYKKEIKQYIDDQLDPSTGQLAVAIATLEQQNAEDIDEAIDEIEKHFGIDTSISAGNNMLSAGSAGKIYTLGASRATPVYENQAVEINALREEIAALRAELDDLKTSGNKKTKK